MKLLKRNFVHQAIHQKPAKTLRRSIINAQLFIQVERCYTRPVDVWRISQVSEKLILRWRRGEYGNCAAALLNGMSNLRRNDRGGFLAHRFSILVDIDIQIVRAKTPLHRSPRIHFTRLPDRQAQKSKD